MQKTGLGLIFVAALAVGLVACGGDDGDGSSSGGGSFGAIANSIAMPTGTVDMTSAPAIAEEFELIQSSNANGDRFEQGSGQTITMNCPEGGNFTTTASGNQQAVTGQFTYNACCYQAGCCFSGDGTFYYTMDGASDYSQCFQYDLSTSCEGSSANISYEGCLSGAGEFTYVVRVSGETFAVSGNYSNGSGTLDIRGENGEFTCTYSNGMGSCTGDGSFSF